MKPKTPRIILQTKAETLAWLADHDESFEGRYEVQSLWLCDELNRFEKDGYVYNRDAKNRIMAENQISLADAERRVPGNRIRTEDGLLGSLIYNAQGYRREMNLERDGWTRFSQAFRHLIGQKVIALCNGSLSPECEAKVVEHSGRIYLAPPKSRTKVFASHEDWWIKLPTSTESRPASDLLLSTE